MTQYETDLLRYIIKRFKEIKEQKSSNDIVNLIEQFITDYHK
jgi:hypothetical protein